MVVWFVVAVGVVAHIADGVDDGGQAVAAFGVQETDRRSVVGMAGFVDEKDAMDTLVAVVAVATAVGDVIVSDCSASGAHTATLVWVVRSVEVVAADTSKWALASYSLMAAGEAHRSAQT